MELGLLFLVLACIFGFAMAWGVGANDLANVMSTSMGSQAVSVPQAIIIAIIFEFAGAFFGGIDVTNTLRHGIIDTDHLTQTPLVLIYGMLALLFSGGLWMLLASYLGLPISITNAIVGGMVGFGVVVIGVHAIYWHQVLTIAITWLLSPTVAGMVAYFIFRSLQLTIFVSATPLEKAHRYLPVYFFIVGMILAVMVIIKGLDHFAIPLHRHNAIMLTVTMGLMVMFLGMFLMKRISQPKRTGSHEQFKVIEKYFGILMVLTACAMVFAHGSNDVAIASGPMAIVVDIVRHGGVASKQTPITLWVLFLACIGVIAGFLMYGRKVIETVGKGITALTPSRGFAATVAAASTVVASTSMGIPVSATQTLVGAILGVGLARGIGALNLTVIRNIFMSWFVTLPVASILTIIFYFVFKWLF